MPVNAVNKTQIKYKNVVSIINSSGDNTNMYGMIKAAMASFDAFTPVRIGSPPDTPEAAKAASEASEASGAASEAAKAATVSKGAAAAVKPAINSKLHSKTSINNATNIENPNVSNTEPINKYLRECREHQEAYIAKHNEIKKLFEHLMQIIEIIKLILDIIRTLSQVKSIQKRRRIGALPSVKIPKALS